MSFVLGTKELTHVTLFDWASVLYDDRGPDSPERARRRGFL